MKDKIKACDLIFGDAMLLPNDDKNWQFILAGSTYTLDAPSKVLISRMLKQNLALKEENEKLEKKLFIQTNLAKTNNDVVIKLTEQNEQLKKEKENKLQQKLDIAVEAINYAINRNCEHCPQFSIDCEEDEDALDCTPIIEMSQSNAIIWLRRNMHMCYQCYLMGDKGRKCEHCNIRQRWKCVKEIKKYLKNKRKEE